MPAGVWVVGSVGLPVSTPEGEGVGGVPVGSVEASEAVGDAGSDEDEGDGTSGVDVSPEDAAGAAVSCAGAEGVFVSGGTSGPEGEAVLGELAVHAPKTSSRTSNKPMMPRRFIFPPVAPDRLDIHADPMVR